MRGTAMWVLAIAGLTVVGCSSSGTASPASQPGTGPAGTVSPTGTTAQPSSGSTAGSIALSGAFTGTATATLCTGSIASIEVRLDGDSETYRGSISATSFGFVGPEAADYSLKAGDAKPVASPDGTSFTVKGATLVDLVSKKTVTATGTVTCP